MNFRDFVPPILEGWLSRGRKEIEVEEGVEEELFSGVSEQNMWKLVQAIRDLKKDKENQQKDIENMMKDSVVQSAVELMADDATQVDYMKDKIVWIESDGDKKIAEELDDWLHNTVEIEKNIWTYAYEIVSKGGMFLKTFYSDKEFEKESDKDVGDYFEIVNNYLDVTELRKYGETVGYYVDLGKKMKVYPKEDYIHFISDRLNNRNKVEIKRKEGDEEEVDKYTTRHGTSFLNAARSAYKTLKLMEDVLIMSRVLRSAMFRLIQVEVGTAGKKDTLKIIRNIKNRFESRESFNRMSDLYERENSPIPINSNIFTPVRNGKGGINVEEIGGRVDVKDIVDIDYFRNKFFAAIKIPKPFLGFSEEMPGSIGNGTSLTKLDIRYARTVKRVVNILREGIKEMCIFYLIVNEKKDKIGKFKVRSTKISSAEEAERMDELDTRIRLADSINGLLSRDYKKWLKEKDYLEWLINEVIGQEGLKEVLKDESEVEEDDDGNGSGGRY